MNPLILLQRIIDHCKRIEEGLNNRVHYCNRIKEINNIPHEHIDGFSQVIFKYLSFEELTTTLLVCKAFFTFSKTELSSRIPVIVEERTKVAQERALAEKRLHEGA